MADETNTQATQPAQNLYVYYYSDPDGATKDLRCHAIYTEIPFSTLPWHVHKEKPDESLVDPVWSNNANTFVENNGKNQAQILAQAQTAIADLTKEKNTLDQDIKSVQSAQTANGQQSAAIMQAMSKMTGQIEARNKVTLQIQKSLAQLSAAKTQTTTDSASNTQQGGNN